MKSYLVCTELLSLRHNTFYQGFFIMISTFWSEVHCFRKAGLRLRFLVLFDVWSTFIFIHCLRWYFGLINDQFLSRWSGMIICHFPDWPVITLKSLDISSHEPWCRTFSEFRFLWRKWSEQRRIRYIEILLGSIYMQGLSLVLCLHRSWSTVSRWLWCTLNVLLQLILIVFMVWVEHLSSFLIFFEWIEIPLLALANLILLRPHLFTLLVYFLHLRYHYKLVSFWLVRRIIHALSIEILMHNIVIVNRFLPWVETALCILELLHLLKSLCTLVWSDGLSLRWIYIIYRSSVHFGTSHIVCWCQCTRFGLCLWASFLFPFLFLFEEKGILCW